MDHLGQVSSLSQLLLYAGTFKIISLFCSFWISIIYYFHLILRIFFLNFKKNPQIFPQYNFPIQY